LDTHFFPQLLLLGTEFLWAKSKNSYFSFAVLDTRERLVAYYIKIRKMHDYKDIIGFSHVD
jgi:hypothetical protein